MNLGFDLDEVVVDLVSEMELHLGVQYGIEWTIHDFIKFDIMECNFHSEPEFNGKIQKELKELANDADFQFKAEPFPEAKRAIQLLKKTGHKIIFITSRPKQNQPLTFRWLRNHGIPFDALEVIGHSEDKGFYGRRHNLDMFVDDCLPHLESMYSYKKNWRKGLLLLDKPWNSDYIDSNRFRRVKNWNEILRHIGVQNR